MFGHLCILMAMKFFFNRGVFNQGFLYTCRDPPRYAPSFAEFCCGSIIVNFIHIRLTNYTRVHQWVNTMFFRYAAYMGISWHQLLTFVIPKANSNIEKKNSLKKNYFDYNICVHKVSCDFVFV